MDDASGFQGDFEYRVQIQRAYVMSSQRVTLGVKYVACEFTEINREFIKFVGHDVDAMEEIIEQGFVVEVIWGNIEEEEIEDHVQGHSRDEDFRIISVSFKLARMGSDD